MTPYEFGKEAASLPPGAAAVVGNVMRGAGNVARSAGTGIANFFGRGGAGRAIGIQAQRAGLRAQDLGRKAMNLTPAAVVGGAADRVGGLGQFTMNTMRRGLNAGDDLARYAMNGPGRSAPAGMRFGDRTIGATQAAAKRFGSSAMTNARNPLNLAVGGGALAAGAHYGGLLGGGEDQQGDMQNGMQGGMHAGAYNGGGMGGDQHGGGFGSSRMMDMWNNLPTEAKWAIGAGVPMALAGGLMGGRGGMGLGALGLGAAALGGASSGMFGEDARRLVGKGIYNVGSFFGGGGNDPMSQIDQLGRFSPGMGATVLMGRDPSLSSDQALQQYNFLTQNKDMIRQMLPTLQKQGAAALYDATVKGARCWKGYEPVPGKKPYSDDSCRPVGSKKKKDKAEEKKAAKSIFTRPTMTQMPPKAPELPVAPRPVPSTPAPYHSPGQEAMAKAIAQEQLANASPAMVKTQSEHSTPRGETEMTTTPSSRGETKVVDDKQHEETKTPVPTDATNDKQENEKLSLDTLTLAQLDEKIAAGLPVGLLRSGGKLLGSAARGISSFMGSGAQAAGRAVAGGGGMMANQGAQMMQRGLQQGGLRGFANTALGAGGAMAGGAANLAGRTLQGAGQLGSMASKYTASALPVAGLGLYGAHQATKSMTQPYTNAAQQFGANVANSAAQGAQAVGQGIHDTGAAMGDAVGTAYGNTRNAVVNTANNVRRGVNNAASAVAAVPQAIGQGIHDTGAAMGDAVGSAYGAARNSVVNTANDVRRGVTNAAQTARSYVPGIRNPFYYQ